MAKTEKPKVKSKTKSKFTDKAQSERFIETARQFGIEETGDAFERAFKRISLPKNRPVRSTSSKNRHKRSDMLKRAAGLMFVIY